MPFYYDLKADDVADQHTAAGLLRLKQGLKAAGVPQRTIGDTLLLATWNIREFDSEKGGPRTREALHYIAEIISAFDLVAVQEVRDDVSALRQVAKILGHEWSFVMTDVTLGHRGNRERMAFLYDTRKITFGGLAGGVVIPPLEEKGRTINPAAQLARTPFMVGFQAGWLKFTICTTHIIYGKAVAESPERIEEIRALARHLAQRARDRNAWARNMILLGDFNIFSPTDATFREIVDAGFTVPPQIQQLPANLKRDKHYDQIAFIAPDVLDQLKLCNAGVFDYYQHVFRDNDEDAAYFAPLQKPVEAGADLTTGGAASRRRYRDWRTYQMSDHLPLWIELQVNFATEYLTRKSGGQPMVNVAAAEAAAPATVNVGPGTSVKGALRLRRTTHGVTRRR